MFIVCGEALMDVFAAGETPTGTTLDARIGGSPYNVAFGLARQGQPVAFLGAVSTGFLGDRLMRSLAEEGVGTVCTVRTPAPTTLSLVGLDQRGVPSYAFYGTGGADRQLLPEHLALIPAEARAFHFGSYATVVEPIASTARALIEREHARSVIAYDPNVRLNVEPDTARWRDQIEWMLPRTHVLKVSDEDLALLYPGEPIEAIGARWKAAGPRVVVVTRGGDGAIAWGPAGRVDVPPVKVTVIDTVGAGDTFQCSLLTWLAEHDRLSPAALDGLTLDELRAAAGFAAQAAALTCSRRGADLPRRAELP